MGTPTIFNFSTSGANGTKCRRRPLCRRHFLCPPPYPSVSASLPLCLPPYLCARLLGASGHPSVFQYDSGPVSVLFFLCLSYVSISHAHSACVSLYHTNNHGHSLYLFIYLSLCVSVCLSLPLTRSPCVSVCNSFSPFLNI